MLPRLFAKLTRSKNASSRELSSFAYKMACLALGGNDAPPDVATVIEAIGITNPETVPWNAGVDRIYTKNDRVLVTPPWERWVFVAGPALFGPCDAEWTQTLCQFMADLSGRPDINTVQSFASSRSVGAYRWAQAVDGEVTRCFAVSGDGGIVADNGAPLALEDRAKWEALAPLEEEEGGKEAFAEMGLWADEELVRVVADHWSIDPVRLTQAMDKNAMVTVGLLNRFPPLDGFVI